MFYRDYEFQMVLNYWIVHTSFLNMHIVCQFKSSYIFFLEGDNEQKRRIYIYCKLSRLGILLPKLFWPTERKKCSSDQKKLLKGEMHKKAHEHIWLHFFCFFWFLSFFPLVPPWKLWKKKLSKKAETLWGFRKS